MAFFDDLALSNMPMTMMDGAEHSSSAVSMPAAVPASPCDSDGEESTAFARAPSVCITGRLSDIEYRYRVDPRVLGAGHHGSVRACIERATGRRYAVKSVFKDDPAVEPARLAREIALLRETKHRSILRLVDVHEDVAFVHLVTDLCGGGELFDRIVEESSRREYGAPCLAEDTAARIMRQILSALSYMHERNVVHRDIKPENILFETSDKHSPVRIIDFGLARRHAPNEPPMSTVVGTPYYIAPEILRRRYDRSCDLWSAGVVAYAMLHGRPPFDGGSDVEVYAAVQRGRYSFLSPGTSWASRDFIRRLLRRDPRERMTAEQALRHPWIVKHAATDVAMIDDDRGDKPSVEVDYQGLLRDSMILCGCMEATRMLMFADL